MSARPVILVQYTELAPYVLACLNALVDAADAEIHLVRWPVNQEAPFALAFNPRITVWDRNTMSDQGLIDLVARTRPVLAITSGWVDRGYLKAAAQVKRMGRPSMMILDTAWRGDWRQWANAIRARFTLHRSFTHSWVTGGLQAEYAVRLGFAHDRIRSGFYSADTSRFLPLGVRLLMERKVAWPHRLLCVARYIPTKGQQQLCDAFAGLCDAGDAGDWELWLAGTGELREHVMASRSGRHARIRHLGFKQPEEMEAIVDQCGAFILPSTFEPWGVVVHEHACSGLPLVLSSAVGAAERFLREGENGFRFAAGDPSAMRLTLLKLFAATNAELRAMGQRSLELGQAWSPQAWAATAAGLIGEPRPASTL